MEDFYLPSAPPSHLTGFALHVLSEKRFVGSPLKKHIYIPAHDQYQTGWCGSNTTTQRKEWVHKADM